MTLGGPCTVTSFLQEQNEREGVEVPAVRQAQRQPCDEGSTSTISHVDVLRYHVMKIAPTSVIFP